MTRTIVAVITVYIIFTAVLFADTQPPLPVGLSQVSTSADKQNPSSDLPALPAGLDDSSSTDNEPQLPTGLDSSNLTDDSSATPTLPSGLDSSSGSKVPDYVTKLDHYADDTAVTGFIESRIGYRLQNDKNEKDASIGETRLQLQIDRSYDEFIFECTADLYYDWVEPESVDLEKGTGWLDLRTANVAFSPTEFMDLKIGRQILTWGTGDLLFINDLFPKDWLSFFLGRDTEYLKAPSDAVKLSLFADFANIDFIFSPKFDSDRYITGQRISHYNGQSIVGQDNLIHTDKPNDYFKDNEMALRVSKNISGYELAAYCYWGYWKSPAGLDTATSRYTFPRLNVYGLSARGQFNRGIANIEIGYYNSRSDTSGKNPYINNSQMRYLIGYEQDLPEIAQDFTVAVQFYLEQTLQYSSYRRNLPALTKAAEQYRQLLTLRITKLYFNQNLTCSVFTYFSPTDRDMYTRPNINYKINDDLAVEAGANIFFGDRQHTFFSQFSDNTNMYAAIRYSF